MAVAQDIHTVFLLKSQPEWKKDFPVAQNKEAPERDRSRTQAEIVAGEA